MNNLLFSMLALSEGLLKALTSTFGGWYVIILNAFGVFAIVCKVFEYQAKKRDTMFALVITANILWVFYFVFYGDLSSALTCLIGSVRLVIFMQRGKHKWANSMWWLVFFLALQTIISIFTYTGWKDVFSISAGFVGIIAYFIVDQKKYRWLSLAHMSIWVINGATKVYPIALISDSISVVSIIIAIIRFSIIEKKEKSANAFSNVLNDNKIQD